MFHSWWRCHLCQEGDQRIPVKLMVDRGRGIYDDPIVTEEDPDGGGQEIRSGDVPAS